MDKFSVDTLRVSTLKYNDVNIDLSVLADISKDQYGRVIYQGRVLGNVKPIITTNGVVIDKNITISGESISSNIITSIQQSSSKTNWIKYQAEIRLPITTTELPNVYINGLLLSTSPTSNFIDTSYTVDDTELIRFDINDSLKFKNGGSIINFLDINNKFKLLNVSDNIQYDIDVTYIDNDCIRITPSIVESGKTYKILRGTDINYYSFISDIVITDTRLLEILTDSNNIHNIDIKLWMKS